MIFPREDDAKTSPSDNVMVYCFNCYKVFTVFNSCNYFLYYNNREISHKKLVDKIYIYKNQGRYVGVNVST